MSAMCLIALCVAPAALAGQGRDQYKQYVENNLVYENEELLSYVRAIGNRLLAHSPHAGREYTYVLVDDASPNAQATADQYIFVNRGLFVLVKSEAELAAVIGHEIGHVTGHHAARLKTRAYFYSALGWLGSLATGTNAIGSAANSVSSVELARFKRMVESEADELGAEYVARAGYDPTAVVGMLSAMKDFQTLQTQTNPNAKVYHGLFGSHPKNDKRVHDAVARATNLLPDQLVEPVGDFYAMIDGLPYGDEAATGVVKDRSFYHGMFRFVVTFPEGWTVTNSDRDVSGTAPGGGQDASINLSRLSPSGKNQDPEEYVRETLKRDDIKSGEQFKVGSFPAYIGEIEVLAGDATARMIAVVYKDKSVFLFKGESGPVGDPERFKEQFRETVNSFRALEESDLKIAQTHKLRVIVAQPGDTFASIADRSSLKSQGEDFLRVINGWYPRGEPHAGDSVKIIE